MIDIQTVCWSVAYILGMVFFLTGIIYLIRKKNIREHNFIKAGAFEFIASWILYIPEELFNDVPESVPVLEVIESICTALLRTFNIYLGNDYSRVAFKGHPVFSSLYATLITVVNITLLLFVAGFIMQLLSGPVQRIKLSLFKKRYSYIFQVCNEKTIAIARSINKSGVNIIFASGEDGFDKTEKQIISDINGIYIDESVNSVLRKISKSSKGIEIFLFGNTEEGNLDQLEKICKVEEKILRSSIRIFVELSDTPWNLYENFLKEHNKSENEKLIINFIRVEENFVYNNLLKNSIFDNAKYNELSKDKDIKILLIGMNERNFEMLKALLHLGQMPGYRLTLMILDDRVGGCEALKSKIPEIRDYCDKFGDAVYRLVYKENVEFYKDEYDKKILNPSNYLEIIRNEYNDFTFAFVNAGNDLLNVNMAMKIHSLCYRNGRNDYKIQVNVDHQKICDDWSKELIEKLQFVGDIDSTYDINFITMSDIEKASRAIHEIRHREDGKSWIAYCNNEYNRHSVYARTLSFKYKVQIIHDLEDPSDKFKGTDDEWNIYRATESDERWKAYEHMRWNMYTRSMGYILADDNLLNEHGELDRRTRAIAKVHNDLVDYSVIKRRDLENDDNESKKDEVMLTPEVVVVLRNI